MFKFCFIVSMIISFFWPVSALLMMPIYMRVILKLMSKFRKKRSDIVWRTDVPIYLWPGSFSGISGGGILFCLTEINKIQPGIWYNNFFVIHFSSALFVLGCYIHIFALLTLREMFNAEPSIIKNQKVITHGPYMLVRHPIYLAFILYNFCFVLLSGNPFWIILLSGYTFLWAYSRASIEEKLLSNELADEYTRYKSNTPMLIPTFRSTINFLFRYNILT